MEELDADHKMYHYISDIVETLRELYAQNYIPSHGVDKALDQSLEIKEYLKTLLEIKIMFIEGPK